MMKRLANARSGRRQPARRRTFQPRIEEFENRVVPAAPATPSNLHVDFANGGQAELVWTRNSTDETGFSIERNSAVIATTGANGTTLVDFNAAVGTTYSYRVRAFNADGFSNYSNVVSFRYQTPVAFTPSPVGAFDAHQDVGSVAVAGSASFAATTGTYTVRASGSDIWDVADHMHYVYKRFDGDGEVITRVTSIGADTDFWAKGGVMIRESLAPGARDAFSLETSQNGGHNEPVFQWRADTGGGTADPGNHMNGIQAAPVWLRLVRAGNNFSGYWAHDNGGGMHGPWNQMGSTQTLDVSYDALVGLGLTAHNDGLVNTSTFDNLQFVQAQAGTAASLAVIAPATAQAGNLNLTVDARDANNNRATGYRGTIHFTSSVPTDTVPGDYGFQAGDSGAASFAFTFRSVGTHTITARDTVTGAVMGTATITVGPAAATTLAVAGFPAATTAGVAGTVTVTARDQFGNTDTNFNGFVHVTSTDPQAVVPADTRLAAGTATLPVTLRTAGTQSITVRDSLTGMIAGSQTGITVSPAATSVLLVGGFPNIDAGQINTFVVTAKDAYGNTTPAYAGTVHFSSSDSRALLQGDYQFQPSDGGSKAFGAVLYTAGAQSITARDTVTGSLVGTQTGIVVRPLAASQLVVSGFPSPIRGNQLALFTVTAEDRFGNTDTSYRGQVALSSSDPNATLEAPYTYTAADNGVHRFAGVLRSSGDQTVTATDTANGFSGTQTVRVVLPATFLDVQVSGGAVAGQPFQITVTARDDSGNADLFYAGTVSFSSSDPNATLPPDYTFVSSDAGSKAFTVTLGTEGTQEIDVSDGTISGGVFIDVGSAGSPGVPGGQRLWQAVAPPHAAPVVNPELSSGGVTLGAIAMPPATVAGQDATQAQPVADNPTPAHVTPAAALDLVFSGLGLAGDDLILAHLA